MITCCCISRPFIIFLLLLRIPIVYQSKQRQAAIMLKDGNANNCCGSIANYSFLNYMISGPSQWSLNPGCSCVATETNMTVKDEYMLTVVDEECPIWSHGVLKVDSAKELLLSFVKPRLVLIYETFFHWKLTCETAQDLAKLTFLFGKAHIYHIKRGFSEPEKLIK